VSEFGPVVDEDQQARRLDAFEQGVQERPRLGVQPLEVFEHEHERPLVGLLHDETRQGVQDTAPALAWVERVPRMIDGKRVQQRQDSRGRRVELPVERQHLVRHLRCHLGRRVALVQLEVRSEELDHRHPARALLVRERARLQDAPVPRELRGDELVNQA
jgi:hypothetical protein